jgi:DeoR/GlpR family transcriptional regulator of sugar metabolism
MRAPARNRRDTILAELYSNKEVTSVGLAQLLKVSDATVRRDLRALAEAGQVDLHHGGAVLPKNSDSSFRSKAMRNVEAKRVIGQLACEQVGDGDQIFVDSGTTCFEMVPRLKQKRGVSVIVNSARLALELDSPSLRVILLGGLYRPYRMDTVGPLALVALDQLRGFTAFLGSDGLSMEYGLTASDLESAYMYRQVVGHALHVVLLADHTKFFAPSLCKLVEWDRISRVVTDCPPPPEWQTFFSDKRIAVTYPGSPPSVEAAAPLEPRA